MINSRYLRRALWLFRICFVFSFHDFSAAQSPWSRPQACLYVTQDSTGLVPGARLAKYEPPAGCYLGAFIDFDGSLHEGYRDVNGSVHHEPEPFEAIVGKPHAMYFFYLGYGRPLPMDWVGRLAAAGKFVHIALEPNGGLSKVHDDAYLHELADDMALTRAKIFLRFASEMNGDWTNYHKDPKEYRRKFRLVYRVMHQRAPNVALVWCPYTSPRRNMEAYYPGDDATDWVGVNMYSVTYHNNKLTMPAEQEHPCDLLGPIYARYSRSKPFMICEFAATHYAACEHRERIEFAERKIAALYTALPRLFPRVKCINYFDSNNIKFVSTHGYNDYSVTDHPVIKAAYETVIRSPYFLSAPFEPGASPIRLPIPSRILSDQLLHGNVTLSGWASNGPDACTLVYKVDGRLIYKTSRPTLWDVPWNAGSVPAGRHTLSLEIRNQYDRTVARQSLRIRTQP